jgi:hypothetical protein
METPTESLSVLISGSPWYESTLRAAQLERTILLWASLDQRGRLQGMVGYLVGRDGEIFQGPLIGGTVWEVSRGVRSPVLDARRSEIGPVWKQLEAGAGGRVAVVGYRMVHLQHNLPPSLPVEMRSALNGALWVDLHEAASLLRKSSLSGGSEGGLLPEAQSTSLRDLAALAGELIGEDELAESDLRGAEIAMTVWTRVLLPKLNKIPVRTSSEAEVVDTPSPRESGRLPAHIAAILDGPLDEEQEPARAVPYEPPLNQEEERLATMASEIFSGAPLEPVSPEPAASEPTEPDRSRYQGAATNGGWLVTRADGSVLAPGPLAGLDLATALLVDLRIDTPEAAARLCERIIDHLPVGHDFAIGAPDLRELSS